MTDLQYKANYATALAQEGPSEWFCNTVSHLGITFYRLATRGVPVPAFAPCQGLDGEALEAALHRIALDISQDAEPDDPVAFFYWLEECVKLLFQAYCWGLAEREE